MITGKKKEVPMRGIIPKLSYGQRRRLRRRYKREPSAIVKVRILILLRLDVGDSSVTIERNGICVRSSVSHVAGRFCELGELGLEDGRQYNGRRKVTETVLRELADLVAVSPLDYGWSRPTWTRELLALQLERETGVRLSLATLSCFLRKMGAKWKRPNMFVLCPWSRRRRARRLAAIRRLVENLPPDEAAFFEDEVDIHLNPKPGLDWMLNRQQKRILTPGQNEKCYVAGALNARNGNLVWVGGMSKASDLFIDLLKKLYRDYRRFSLIHLIVDNYSIHSSGKTQKTLEALGGKIVLHFPISLAKNPTTPSPMRTTNVTKAPCRLARLQKIPTRKIATIGGVTYERIDWM